MLLEGSRDLVRRDMVLLEGSRDLVLLEGSRDLVPESSRDLLGVAANALMAFCGIAL